MLVVVVAVCGVAVTIVDVVDVVAVGNGDVAAALAVDVASMVLSGDVLGGFALVPVAFVQAVDVALVDVVGVVAVPESNVAAASAVGVGVGFVNCVCHDVTPYPWCTEEVHVQVSWTPCLLVFITFSVNPIFIPFSIAGECGKYGVCHSPGGGDGETMRRPCTRVTGVKISRRLKTLSVSAAAVLAGTLGAAPLANAAAPAIATQGHIVQTSDGTTCTIGYVEGNRAWTAAHCGVNGQAVYNEYGSHIGTLRYFREEGATGQDIAYIQFAAGTVSGGNPVSGDGIGFKPADGNGICITGRNSPENCGKVVRRPMQAAGIYSSTELFKQHGDSGAGAYVKGQPGVVGIYSGTATFIQGGKRSAYEDIAYFPSPQERAGLPQGYVPRKPDLVRRANTILDVPALYFRAYLEPAEAILALIMGGFSPADFRGLMATLGITGVTI